ncbi:Transmembrane protein 104 homolog [Caenorhabditis elegans]|uniref:Putative sodium-coupled neutral amino acid transporter 12 n=1 Tax=Caenorhabditis elegans TaxID=6239 RepID=S38AC_CAEEL|nr:Transmembrane protein 104 homolog [Caenorhabditis elegans]Q17598.2 RecName: Full=Transmembrane protein 104 homolog [Caenorhabditis elegans]CAA97776.2 Transmembrane protein 104 homolog [Caenorhabditis elegans]|eukprot:NP_509879.2 Transmembrane protein 104 homolog [Caenorhabditis elegans]
MQSNTDSSTSGTYSQTVGLLYVFNLIVGTGALALPKAFQTAGWLLSITLLTFSAFMSYVAATFVIEALSVANAVLSKKRRVEYDDVVVADGPSTFEISKKVEVSEMASMFLSKVSLVFSYFAIIIYLFGDLAIYSTTVPKSAMNIVCATINASTVKSSDPCHESWPEILTRMTVYRFFVIIFVVVVCLPMVIAGITKTRHIQIMTTLSRWAAFILMISLATMQLSSDGAAAHPPAYNFHGFGSLFGCAVYAFMCHHSIPSLITPMRTKDNVFGKIALVYGVVGVFYFTLSLTGAFAFEHVQDIYTLNFFHDGNTSFIYSIIDYFLALFPIITLTSSYPIIALTLINNFNVVKDILCPKVGQENESLLEADSLVEDNDTDDEREARNARNEKSVFDVLVPALVLALPTFLSLLTDDMLLLASITGSFPGVAVQFAIPCLLVTAARKHARSVLNFPVPRKNNSPFQSPIWIVLISSWAGFSMIMVLLNLVGVKF